MLELNEQEKQLLSSIEPRHSSMVETTRRLADINSGSFNPAGINAVNQEFVSIFSPLSDTHKTLTLETIPLVQEDGQVKNFETSQMQLFSARPEAPLQILCTGHSDTVFPIDSEFQKTWIEGNHLRGPGVADMKGGLVILSEALRAIHHSPFKDQVGFTVAISPDEEIGSPSSAAELTKLAKKADYGLVYEPALSDGTLAGARKGSGNFTVVCHGKSVHAGRDFFSGRNALTAIARLAIMLEELSDEAQGISVNIGKFSGGGAVNVVPDLGICRFNVRVQDPQQQTYVEEKIHAYIEQVEQKSGCKFKLHGNFNRPPKPVNERQQSMFDLLKMCGQQLDIDIAFKATGGCCEGNNLAAAGLVNIDTLGVRGGAIHSEDEFACLDSFVERAQLSALLIAKLCSKQA
ncbi:hydrolase [Agarilytica rhodophyticola]|uniref:hydrolase n=1 Tax=Agarilytica rhodophyticola TaxID=1737490 RepID=UPI000B3486E6|nr:hydrolase [Agarilytica rhodophyticola]